ncbi:Longin-like domain-containing protein [Dipodascopsis tothii]|uniref:Longin-like domain-containing protein n=1 Tax=Dipodascopsis tothii TaxID=44089 RepID=UPI0034CDF1F1
MAALSLYTVQAVLVLDSNGKRVFSQYYGPPHGPAGGRAAASRDAQRAFEKGLFAKTRKQATDILLYDGSVVVYKEIVDVVLYVVGAGDANESLLYLTVVALRDALDILLKHAVDRRTIVDGYDLVALAIDETVDDGIIIETDAEAIAGRVSRPLTHDTPGRLDLSEQGLKSAYQLAKERFAERLKNSL